MLYTRRVHQVIHLNKVGLFLYALSICMIPLFVINTAVQILIPQLILVDVVFDNTQFSWVISLHLQKLSY